MPRAEDRSTENTSSYPLPLPDQVASAANTIAYAFVRQYQRPADPTNPADVTWINNAFQGVTDALSSPPEERVTSTDPVLWPLFRDTLITQTHAILGV